MSNIIDMPKKETQTMFGCSIGPEWHTVFIEGRKIPKMLVRKWEEKVELQFDGRWVYIFEDEQHARHAASLAATALAVGMGYSHIGAMNKNMPFAPECVEV